MKSLCRYSSYKVLFFILRETVQTLETFFTLHGFIVFFPLQTHIKGLFSFSRQADKVLSKRPSQNAKHLIVICQKMSGDMLKRHYETLEGQIPPR